jgi:hypothetical protein
MYLGAGDGLRPPEELTRVALGDGTEAEKVRAALDLARSGEPGRAAMKKVLAESKSPAARAAVIQGLGELEPRDLEIVPVLLKLVKDPREDAWVRGRAAVAIGKILGHKFDYQPDDRDAARQQKAILQMELEYQKALKRPTTDS